MVEIIFDGKVPKNSIVLEGFQGIGLVGTLAAEYIAEQKNAKVVGHVDVPEFPPITLLVNGRIKTPIRIYHFKEKKQNFLIFVSELPMPQKMANVLAKAIVNFSKEHKVKEIVSLEGITVPEEPVDSNTYWISSNPKFFENRFGKKAKALQSGIIVGVSASLLTQSKIQKIPSVVLMAEAHTNFPDGSAASSIIKLLNKVYKIDVDVNNLEAQSEEFEKKIWKMIEKAKTLKNSNSKPGKTYIG